MNDRWWRSPRARRLGAAMVGAAAFKAVATAVLGVRVDPWAVTSTLAVALSGIVLWVAGRRPG